jgi:hypothetical protein
MTHETIKGGAFLGKVGDFFKSIVNNDAVKNLAIKGATAVAEKVANKLKINPIYSFRFTRSICTCKNNEISQKS